MKKYLFRIFVSIIIASILAISLTSAVFADSGTNISVNVSAIDIPLSQGQSYNQVINVSSSGSVNLTAEVDGLTQTPQGASGPVQAQQDTDSFSARTFISLDKTSLSLSAGTSQNITVSVNVPTGTAPGERYASIYIYSQPGQGGVSIVTGILIPVIINTPGYTVSQIGNIIGFSCSSLPSLSNVYTGKTIDFDTTFNNTGNCRMTGVQNIITVKDGSGNQKWTNTISVPAPSILPQTPRIIDNQDTIGLSAGNYSVESDVTLANGTMLDHTTINFNVIDPPVIPGAPGLTSPGNNTSPGTVITTLTPTFQWNTVSGADYYMLTVSRTPYSSNNIIYASDQLIGTSFTMPNNFLFNGQTYCWQVTATNISGTSPSSSTYYFQTPGSYSPPAVATNIASNITDTTATLNGNLSDSGSATRVNVNFQYGTSTSYGTLTPIQTLTAGGAFQANITGLTPGTTYHFQVNAGGLTTVYGNDLTFTTLPATTTTTATSTTTTTSTSTTTTTTPILNEQVTTSMTTTETPSIITTDVSNDVLPGMDASTMVGLSFNNVVTPHVDAVQKANTEVTLTGVSGNGSIIVGAYTTLPSANIAFSDGTIKGGTGLTAIQFVDVRTEGYDHGTANVTLHFTDSEISNFDQNSLRLYYYSDNKWQLCENIKVSLSDHTISGNIPVAKLSGTVVGLGGNPVQTSSNNAVSFVGASNNKPANHNISWSLAGTVIALIIIIGSVVFVVERNRKKNLANR
jgi:hypothetical protein